MGNLELLNNKIYPYKLLRFPYYITSLLVFLIGLSIYILFRNNNILLFQVFPKPVFLEMFPLRVRADSILMSLFLYNLPDGLWFLSGLLIIRAVWLTNIKWRLVYFCIFSIIALSMEIFQIFDTIPGTFDFLDIVFMAIFSILENSFFYLFVKRNILC